MPTSAVLIGINSKGIVNDSGVVHLADGGSDTAVDSSVFPHHAVQTDYVGIGILFTHESKKIFVIDRELLSITAVLL